MDWLIGANSTCHLVVDAPSVSSTHCKVTSANGQVLLSDLNSTNGTYVNDQRISTATAIGPDDTIRLGQQTPVAWRQIERLVGSRLIRIGRTADNEVVLPEENVSSHHAQLLLDADQMTLIDLNSSNGTFVGQPDGKIARASVSLNDVVYIASHRFTVKQLLERAGATSPRQVARLHRHPAVWATVAALLLIAFVVIRTRSVAVLTPDTNTEGIDDTEQIVAEPTVDPMDRLRGALYSVVVRSAASEPGIRIGTAWAVADHKLATSGNLVLFLQQSKNDFPVVVVQNLLDANETAVIGSTVHPVCQENADRMAELGEKIEELRRDFDALTEPPQDESGDPGESNQATPDPKAIEEISEQILDLEDQWFVAAEEMIHCDVGLLETAGSPNSDAGRFVLQAAEKAPVRLAAVTVVGGAFPHDQSITTGESAVAMTKLPATIDALVPRQADGVVRPALLCSAEHLQQNWMGAAVLNAEGEAIGLYSRPTPSLQPDEPPAGDHCDIAAVERVKDLLDRTK
ncbi:FHA domain-containing protein [Fuerstiella marisgermanici]|uniref:Type VI secretion system FHA domain protein n=1 Tax=Fuerstiella marisgermanici TaxID=1891926 RepID=A0A1P8WP45_9PLAN|nr:FHA domain-containing protein [Fuerstiella marisgermanici]APZ95830.1 type VI secretion system FHA domain protein [Fuerstiella marisgermanici]